MTNFNEMTYGELIKHVDGAIKALRQKAYGEGYAQGKFEARLDIVDSLTADELAEDVGDILAQRRRDEIVERAKADIEELKRETAIGELYDVFDDSFMDFPNRCYADFKVNRDKRTVVCLLRGYNSNEVYAKGIAKCAPNDCFNVRIGKAIALRRALALDIPDEYLNAPQPTEVRVGDMIKYECDDNPAKVVEEYDSNPNSRSISFVKEFRGYEYKIIDDSREGDDD